MPAGGTVDARPLNEPVASYPPPICTLAAMPAIVGNGCGVAPADGVPGAYRTAKAADAAGLGLALGAADAVAVAVAVGDAVGDPDGGMVAGVVGTTLGSGVGDGALAATA
jgi:hypothetical protein